MATRGTQEVGEALAELRRLAALVASRRKDLDEVTSCRDDLVRDLRRRGLPLVEIAEAAGLSVGRVSQIDGKSA